jgi:hypothetical protein
MRPQPSGPSCRLRGDRQHERPNEARPAACDGEQDVRDALLLALRVIALTLLQFACFALAGGVLGRQGDSGSSGQAAAAGALLTACFLNTLVVTHVILRSRWAGWRLMAALAFVLYGVMTFMPQIESAVFLTGLPAGMLPRLFLMGALVAVPFSVLAVVILGKGRSGPPDAAGNPRLAMPIREWAWRLAAIAVIYVVLYFTFGYFIAWRDPVVRAYYRGTDEGTFFAHFRTVLRDTPWLVPFQLLRALLWAGFAMPVVRMMRGQRLETALAIALLFSVVMNSQLLLPNPFMPEPVRMTHLVETASSNFIFGAIVGWLLTQPRQALPGVLAKPG